MCLQIRVDEEAREEEIAGVGDLGEDILRAGGWELTVHVPSVDAEV